MNELKNLFLPDYFLSVNPHTSSNVLIFYLIFFILVFVFGLLLSGYFKKLSKKIKPYQLIQEKILNQTLSVSIIGLIFIFFSWQEIPYLSVPILIYLLIIIFIYLVITDIIFYKKTILMDVKKYKQELKYQKYLPHKLQK